MSFTITNTYYKLVIRLKTNLSATPVLTYKHIESQYVTNLETLTYTSHTADYSRTDNLITYTIPLRNFEVGDVLDDFICTLNGTTDLFSMNEGISIIVDGEESEVIKTNNGEVVLDTDNQYVKIKPLNQSDFALVFEDSNVHTVQAVYKGNSTVGVVLSNKAIITPQIREEHEEHPEIEGTYHIEFIKYKDTMTYLADLEWEVQLTKGGTPVPNALIQIDNPVGIYTYVTNTNGIVRFRRTNATLNNDDTQLAPYRNWKVGDYIIRARFHYYDETEQAFKELICKTSEYLTIKKGNPNMVVVNYARTKKGTAKFKFTDPQGFPMANIKLVCVVNGKTYNKTTNSSGIISFAVGIKGTITYKIKFAGNNNLNAKNWTFSERITS